MANPKISCICLTRHRVPLLKQAVNYFLQQTYEDSELVIVYDPEDMATEEHVAQITHPRIRALAAPSGQLSLGELRNWGVEFARGEYVATWDDDDYHAPARLRRQMRQIEVSGKDACFLSRWMVHDTAENRTYLSRPRNCEGTMLCKKAVLPRYPAVAKAEDTPLMLALEKQNAIVSLDAPELYVYVIHGKNTWDRSHFVNSVLGNCIELAERENAKVTALLCP